jgi:hypothetical protein
MDAVVAFIANGEATKPVAQLRTREVHDAKEQEIAEG